MVLTERQMFPSREKAKASIMAGLVYVDGQIADKPGMPVSDDAEITIKEILCPYVSRGGLKLEKALELFDFSLEDAVAADIGASKVFAIDVGYGQLDWKLRNDERVVNMEKVNVRYLDIDSVGRDLDFISIDVSFISLKLVFPVASQLLSDEGCLVCLVKPQFEAGRSQVGKKGIVRDPAVHREVIENVIAYGIENGLYSHGLTFSPVTGTKGNIEYLLYMRKTPYDGVIDVEKTVRSSHEELI